MERLVGRRPSAVAVLLQLVYLTRRVVCCKPAIHASSTIPFNPPYLVDRNISFLFTTKVCSTIPLCLLVLTSSRYTQTLIVKYHIFIRNSLTPSSPSPGHHPLPTPPSPRYSNPPFPGTPTTLSQGTPTPLLGTSTPLFQPALVHPLCGFSEQQANTRLWFLCYAAQARS